MKYKKLHYERGAGFVTPLQTFNIYRYSNSRVGRNKTFRAQARISVSGMLHELPETPQRVDLF